MRLTILLFLIVGYSAVYAQEEFAVAGSDTLQFLNLFSKSSKADVDCYRIPAIITASNGDLIAAIDERVPSCADLRGSKDINIVIRRSHDNGKTWSEIETVVDYPDGQSASDPSFILDETTNALFMFFNFMDLNTEKDVYYFRFTKSLDNGKTWSTSEDITAQTSKADWHHDFKFITSGRGIQTSSGKLLHTIVNLEKGLHVFGSDDHGESWFLIDTPILPADESKIVELADGTWMINSRVQGAGLRYIHSSIDEGKSWVTAPDSSLIDPACNASIIRYSSIIEGADKNRLLFSNARSSNSRENMTISLSYDEGKSWPVQKTIYAGSAAYSSLSVLPNGEIVLFFEANDYQDNLFVRFNLEWLTDGRDR
jgi:sialidase-1